MMRSFPTPSDRDAQFDLAHRVVVGRLSRPVTHENGFIELPLGGGASRLHVWPDVPLIKQKTDNPIHDHRFDFESVVLTGWLEHCVYRLRDHTGRRPPTHRVHVVERGRLRPIEQRVSFSITTVVELPEGASYSFAAREFHTSYGTGLTATIMTKTAVYDGTSRVLCPLGQVPDNDFDRETANPLPLLWSFIDRAMTQAMAMR